MAQAIKKLITSRGEEYALRPVSDTLITMALQAIEKQYREAGEPVDPPTYSVPTASGDTETFAHDETTLRTDEDKTAWAKHLDAVTRMKADQEFRRMKILLRSVQFTIPDNGWEADHRSIGVEVPTDPEERWFHYLTTEVLVTPDDLLNAVELATKLAYLGSGSEAAIEAAMLNFRRALSANAAEQVANQSGTVDNQPEDGGGGSG